MSREAREQVAVINVRGGVVVSVTVESVEHPIFVVRDYDVKSEKGRGAVTLDVEVNVDRGEAAVVFNRAFESDYVNVGEVE